MAILTMATLTMAMLTMAILTMALPTQVCMHYCLLTMAMLTLSIRSMNELTMTIRTHAKATRAVLTMAEGGGGGRACLLWPCLVHHTSTEAVKGGGALTCWTSGAAVLDLRVGLR